MTGRDRVRDQPCPPIAQPNLEQSRSGVFSSSVSHESLAFEAAVPRSPEGTGSCSSAVVAPASASSAPGIPGAQATPRHSLPPRQPGKAFTLATQNNLGSVPENPLREGGSTHPHPQPSGCQVSHAPACSSPTLLQQEGLAQSCISCPSTRGLKIAV